MGFSALTRAIDLHQLSDQLLELIVFESWKRRTLGTGIETLAVAIRTEKTKLAIIATVNLHTLEAFGGIVKTGSSGRDAEVTIGLHLGGLPAIGSSPPHRNHVVGAVGVAHLLGRAGQGNISQVGRPGDLEVGAVKLGHLRCNGTHDRCYESDILL